MVMKKDEIVEALEVAPVWHYRNERCRAVPVELVGEIIAALSAKKSSRAKKPEAESPEAGETFGGALE